MIFLTLDDGRELHGCSLGMAAMYELISDELPNDCIPFKKWLFDMSNRPNPFGDFDLRGISETYRSAFYEAASKANQRLLDKYGPTVYEQENFYSARCLKKLLDMAKRIKKNEAPQEMNDADTIEPFSGEMEDLNQIWSEN